MTEDLHALAEKSLELAELATKGPWRILKRLGCLSSATEDLFQSYKSPTIQISHDLEFIAFARSALPVLASAIIKYQNLLDKVRVLVGPENIGKTVNTNLYWSGQVSAIMDGKALSDVMNAIAEWDTE